MRHGRFISSAPLFAGLLAGRLDASLGRFGLERKGALSVTPASRLNSPGAMKTVRDKEVFMVRSVKANGKTYTMRNKHGIEISPVARGRAAQKAVTL